jgi:hypothetical protein
MRARVVQGFVDHAGDEGNFAESPNEN